VGISVKANMTYMTSDKNKIGLEKNKDTLKGGLCSFQIDNLEFVNLEMNDMKPKLKTNDEIIIVRNGKSRNNRNTSLF
jgi:hypothetical protein